ncbi:T9SS type A sorting domain-containing protein [Chryseobacterium capnotolerans]|uniref:T9SS type A sorting domain-containing protein n=1 Tax=Chryseobacterium TaxID=59732 RepID=UPI00142D79C2|nr:MULTISPECIES: T9SS type A sorting domain-containing protein [Chryseobacterium]UHO36718.1 T9SS type A sorting domain-containing protein [Chryseobacterium capnotolerans]
MIEPNFHKVMLFALLFSSQHLFSQLITTTETQLWERVIPNSREALKCKEESLLNFHCGIRDKLLKKYIRHSRDKSHTLSLVHSSKEDEMIWQDTEKTLSLSNNNYHKGGKNDIELRKRPSLFTFIGNADTQKGNSDSLKIRFADQNLYEMIFLTRMATSDELNKIHSYLSLKYGISLEKGKYFSSEGTELWDPQKHGEYKYRPTGLGRDDGNELYQKQSTNTQDQIVTIGKNDIKRTNAENAATFNNQEFVIWSDDNRELQLVQDGNFSTVKRNWEINFIGSVIQKKDYKVRIEKALLNPKSQSISYWLFLKNSLGEIRKIQGVENEKYIFFNKVDFITEKEGGNTTKFTFAISPLKDPRSQNSESGSTIGADHLSLDYGKIELYPNPVKSSQTFTLRFPAMENLSVSIYDAGGRLVSLEKIDEKSTSYISHLKTQSGYLINLTQNGKIIKTFKLIVE